MQASKFLELCSYIRCRTCDYTDGNTDHSLHFQSSLLFSLLQAPLMLFEVFLIWDQAVRNEICSLAAKLSSSHQMSKLYCSRSMTTSKRRESSSLLLNTSKFHIRCFAIHRIGLLTLRTAFTDSGLFNGFSAVVNVAGSSRGLMGQRHRWVGNLVHFMHKI